MIRTICVVGITLLGNRRVSNIALYTGGRFKDVRFPRERRGDAFIRRVENTRKSCDMFTSLVKTQRLKRGAILCVMSNICKVRAGIKTPRFGHSH